MPDLCREHSVSTATFYKWHTKFGGMDVSLMVKMKQLEDENQRFKRCTSMQNVGLDRRSGLR